MKRNFFKERKIFNNFQKTLNILPVFTSSEIACPNGHKFKIDFREKYPPIRPEKLNNEHISIPISTNIICPKCSSNFQANLPIKKEKKKFYIFGDESYRGDDGKSEKMIVNYSLVAVNCKQFLEVEDEILQFKLDEFPNYSPNDWKIHLKEIISSTHREKNEVFKNLNYNNDIKPFISKLFELLNRLVNRDSISVYTVTIAHKFDKNLSYKNRKNEEKQIKELTYELAILYLTDYLTNSEINPCFIFDSDKKSDKNILIKQEWAENIFNSCQFSLACAYFLKGINVVPPKFIKPASRPFLELADFICYITARAFETEILKNKKEEFFTPKKITKITYVLGKKYDGNLSYGHCFSLEEALQKLKM